MQKLFNPKMQMHFLGLRIFSLHFSPQIRYYHVGGGGVVYGLMTFD